MISFSCLYKSAPVGYLICYLHEREIISAHLAYEYQLKNIRITDFLFNCASLTYQTWSCTTKYRFGADNKNQEQLIAFKTKLGAVKRAQSDFFRQVSPFNASAVIFNPAKIILRNIPTGLFRNLSILTKILYY